MAHAGTMAHSHLMVSLVHAHYINQEIIESKKLSVNIVDEAWLKEADRIGVISGNKEDKSESFTIAPTTITGAGYNASCAPIFFFIINSLFLFHYCQILF